MNNFIEKLGTYQIMTNLLPGVFFGTSLKLLLGITLPIENIGEEIIVYYFMGFVINRISSLIVKPILKKCKFCLRNAGGLCYNSFCRQNAAYRGIVQW